MKSKVRMGVYLIERLIFICLGIPIFSQGQDFKDPVHQPYIFFPYPMEQNKFQSSLGLTFTTIPAVMAEEAQISAPAGDYHALRKINKGFYLDGRVHFQFLQNHFSLGLRWAFVVNPKLSFSFGDDIAWWFGILNIEGFKTNLNGWLNYPNFSAGLRVRKQILLTVKTEVLLNLYYQSKVSNEVTSYSHQTFSGWATSFMMEQPFYKKTNFIIGFRAMRSNFFWQTWSLYGTFKPKLFYPEIITGFIL
jgi:hypothetical protein